MIYQFAFHDGVKPTPPECYMKDMHDKLERGDHMTKADKQAIFDIIISYSYGRNGIYKLAGWVFDFKPYLKRFIVNSYGAWEVIYAFQKGNITNNDYTKDGVTEIHEFPKIRI